MLPAKGEIWLIYDGQCPLCLLGARKFRVEEAAGHLQLLDKRTADPNHPLIQEINASKLNVDKGMVIKYGEQFYQGGDALQLMALIGSNRDWFNRINARMFRSKKMVFFLYPALRAARKLALWLKGVPPIKNPE